MDPTEAAAPLDGPRQLGRLRRGSEGEHQQQPEVAGASGDGPERRDRGPVGPVHVVDREHDRPFRGQPLDMVEERVLREEPRLGRIGAAARERPRPVGRSERIDERTEEALLLELLGRAAVHGNTELDGAPR